MMVCAPGNPPTGVDLQTYILPQPDSSHFLNTFADFEGMRLSHSTEHLQLVGLGVPGSMFTPIHLPPEQPRLPGTCIVIRPPLHTHQRPFSRWGIWHSRCCLCQANLNLGNFCPCNAYTHDHCTSFYLAQCKESLQVNCLGDSAGRLLEGLQSDAPGIRACAICRDKLCPPILITADFTRMHTATFTDMQGRLLWDIQAHLLPVGLTQLRSSLCTRWYSFLRLHGCLPLLAVAADGYAYCETEFHDFYGNDHGPAMWRQALLRTFKSCIRNKFSMRTSMRFSIQPVCRFKWAG
jgi:hypothetical protein